MVEIFYSDLRVQPMILLKSKIEWQPNLSAFEAISQAVGSQHAQQIDKDLHANNQDLIVSWYNSETEDICEIGGVGRLEWDVKHHLILTVHYENASTTSEQIEAFERWCLENHAQNSAS